MISTYQQFLDSKRRVVTPTGFDAQDINPKLFHYQRDLLSWSTKLGKSCLFLDTGLGKTGTQLEYASQVCRQTGGKVLILAPLAVGHQTVREAEKFAIASHARFCSGQDDIDRPDEETGLVPEIVVTNYEKLHRFDASTFAGVVLDESSCIKAQDSKTRETILETFRHTPYRLACTATPAPNDFMELGNHAEFVGAMTRAEMLATFFIHDGGDTSKWRLKGHAEKEFWKWVCSWAVMIRRPSDLGYSDEGFELPPLNIVHHEVPAGGPRPGYLFTMEAKGLQEQREARRDSIGDRVKKLTEVIGQTLSAEPEAVFLNWCNLNDESERLTDSMQRTLGFGTEIRGTHDDDYKAATMLRFAEGRVKGLITKPKICGFGMNFQACHNVGFLGVDNSYESFYQCIRRCYRFGQKHSVNVHIVTSELESGVVENLKRKERDAQKMGDGMVAAMAEISRENLRGTTRTETTYHPNKPMVLPAFLSAKA